MIRANYHLTESQVEQLKRISKATGAPVAFLIRKAVDEWLQWEEFSKGMHERNKIEFKAAMAIKKCSKS